MYPVARATLSWVAFAKLCVVLFLGYSSVAKAQLGTQSWFVRAWQAEDGLPQNAIPAILQTRDGYLWVCTYNGLARFDGVNFTVFDSLNTPGLVNSRVTSLFEDAKENLWIGHETGDLTLYREGQFKPVQFQAAWRSRSINAIQTDEEGNIWLQNADRHLARLSDGIVLMPQKGDLPDDGGLTKDDQGLIWVRNAGRVSVLKNGELIPMDLDAVTPNTHVQGLARSRRGGLWVACDGQLGRWEGNHWVEHLGPPPWGKAELAAFIETQSGYLVAATLDEGCGLYLVSPKGEVTLLNRTNRLTSDWQRSLCEDREGNLWVGSGNGGLSLVRQSEIATVNPPDNWHGRAALSVCTGKNSTLWIGTEGAGIYKFQNEKWDHFNERNGMVNMYIWSVAEDMRGQLWAGTWGYGLWLKKEDGQFVSAPASANFTAPITALLPSQSGGLWAGTGVGLLRLKEDGSTTWLGRSKDLVCPRFHAVLEDGTNRVWFGMADGGLGCLENGDLRQYHKRDGLSNDYINCFHLDADGALWIGTAGGGLNRLKNGRFASITKKQGLPNDFICGIEDDGHGYFWISSHGGIIRVSRNQLNACMDSLINSIYCRVYGKGDGLTTVECSSGFPASCQTADGRLWFPTSHGLIVINPSAVRPNQVPPPVAIEKLLVDGHPVNLSARTSPLRITPGGHRFEFFYTGLSFIVPEKVQFKYKLEGVEKDWVSAGTARSVAYSYLPPGNYAFRVLACNNDGLWNETGAEIRFAVLPFFWQTLWFQGMVWITVVMGVGGAAWFNTRRLMHRKLERVERLRTVERERNRIARDIHDHLGVGLTEIAFLSQVVRKRLNEPEHASVALNQLHTAVRKLTREMDEIVWAVNPQHDTLDSLVTYLDKFAQEFVQASGLRYRLDIPFQLPALPLMAEVRHNVFLAFKEALNNAITHAGATQLDISLATKSNGFLLTVKDNGCGFDPKRLSAELPPRPDRLSHGNGLSNMRQRLAEMGGRLDIESEPGVGTKVLFFVVAIAASQETKPHAD